jgi:hypothetical protein
MRLGKSQSEALAKSIDKTDDEIKSLLKSSTDLEQRDFAYGKVWRPVWESIRGIERD